MEHAVGLYWVNPLVSFALETPGSGAAALLLLVMAEVPSLDV